MALDDSYLVDEINLQKVRDGDLIINLTGMESELSGEYAGMARTLYQEILIEIRRRYALN